MLVTNAGITRDAPFHKMTPEQWQEVIDTNLTGVFNTVHPVWPGMRERKFGRVIVISSINGQKGQFAQVNYAATKAGDLGFAKSLAQEGARAGITANAICPGYIATEMVMAVPEKVRESDHRRRSRSAVWASPKRSRAAWSSSPPTTRASSTARRSRPTARSSSSESNRFRPHSLQSWKGRPAGRPFLRCRPECERARRPARRTPARRPASADVGLVCGMAQRGVRGGFDHGSAFFRKLS